MSIQEDMEYGLDGDRGVVLDILYLGDGLSSLQERIRTGPQAQLRA